MYLIKLQHTHLCPICKKAFMCKGQKCSSFNGIPHLKCSPKNKFAKWTRTIVGGHDG